MKHKFIQSTFILLIGGILTKFLGMFIKILMSRNIGLSGLSLYMLVLPTFSFSITLAHAGIPLSLSRFVAKDTFHNPNLYFTSFVVLLIYHIVLIIFLILFAPIISHYLLHNDSTYLPILMIGFVLPFTTFSSILRSYFIGKERMGPPVLSNIFENILRLIFILFLYPLFSHLSIPYIVSILILSNVLSEGISTLFLFFFLPKLKVKFSFQKEYLKPLFSLSIPSTLSNLIGNITYFLEPILFTSILLYLKYPKNYILEEYGILSGYIFPVLFLPSFFTNAIAQSFFPYMTREYEKRNNSNLQYFFFIQLFIIFLFSIFVCIGFLIFGSRIINLLYHTTVGISYLRVLSPFCFFYYSQSVFQFSFLAMGRGRQIFISSLFSSLVRILSFILFLFLGFGVYSLIYSFILNTVCTTIFNFWLIYPCFS